MKMTKRHPDTGQTLYLTGRKDGSMTDSAYVWASSDGATILDATEDEDQAAVDRYNGGRSITGR